MEIRAQRALFFWGRAVSCELMYANVHISRPVPHILICITAIYKRRSLHER